MDDNTADFGSVFDKLAELNLDATATEQNAKVTEAQEPAAETAEVAPEAVATPTEEQSETPAEQEATANEPVEEEPPVEEPAPASAAQNEDILQRLAELVKQPAPEPAPAIQQDTPAPYTSEEQEFLKTYEKDWPDVAKAESLRRRAEYQQLVGYVFQEVAKVLQPQMETLRTLSEQTHLQQLQSTVGDYDDVRDRVIDWANKQPTYLQAAYQRVIQQGTVDEVADLINRYRQETGSSQTTRAKPVPAKKEAELPTVAKQAAQSLAPVSSKRSAVIAGDDPNDFESAFETFASKL